MKKGFFFLVDISQSFTITVKQLNNAVVKINQAAS
jgi:hypothetical protein